MKQRVIRTAAIGGTLLTAAAVAVAFTADPSSTARHDPDPSSGITATAERLMIVSDFNEVTSLDRLMREAELVVVASPVGTPRHEAVDMGDDIRDTVFANFFQDLAISQTIWGLETGVIQVATLGWNPDARIAREDLAQGSELPPMMGAMPAGEAVFFLKKFPEGGPFSGRFGVVGAKAGWVSLDPTASSLRSGDAGLVELRNRPLAPLVAEIRRNMDARRDR